MYSRFFYLHIFNLKIYYQDIFVYHTLNKNDTHIHICHINTRLKNNPRKTWNSNYSNLLVHIICNLDIDLFKSKKNSDEHQCCHNSNHNICLKYIFGYTKINKYNMLLYKKIRTIASKDDSLGTRINLKLPSSKLRWLGAFNQEPEFK